MSSNAVSFLNSYRPGGRNQQTNVDALIHLIHDQIPAIAVVTVITAVHIKQIVAVLKRHASVLGGALVHTAELLERALGLSKSTFEWLKANLIFLYRISCPLYNDSVFVTWYINIILSPSQRCTHLEPQILLDSWSNYLWEGVLLWGL
jgi:hypothetical protein